MTQFVLIIELICVHLEKCLRYSKCYISDNSNLTGIKIIVKKYKKIDLILKITIIKMKH